MVVRCHVVDPSPLLEAAFRRIERERMAGLPLLNPSLRVQALGFERRGSTWLGALVTPWFLNLVRVPAETEDWRSVADGVRVFHRFGAGDFAFLGSCEAELGEFQSCSLISPMSDFPDQASASATARAALRMLHVERPAATLMGVAARCEPARACAADHAAPAAPTRRVMLFGTGPRRHEA